MPDKIYKPSPHLGKMVLSSISQETSYLAGTRTWTITYSSVWSSIPTRQPARECRHSQEKTAGAEYPEIGYSSSKFALPYTFRGPIAPKPEFSRNTCGLQGSSTPSNSPLLTGSRKSTFTHVRQNLQHNSHPCTMGLTSKSKETRVFTLEPPHGLHTHSCGLQSTLGSSSRK